MLFSNGLKISTSKKYFCNLIRRYCYLVIAAFLLLSNVFAQSNLVEQLEKRLSKAVGNERVDILNQLSVLNNRISLNKSRTYAEEALKLSKSNNYKVGEAVSLKNIAFSFYLENDLDKSKDLNLLAYKILKEENEEKEILSVLNNTGLIFWRRNEFIEAFKYYRKAFNLAERLNDKTYSAEALSNMGLIHWKWSDYARALDLFFKSLKIREEIGDTFEICKTLNNIAFVYNEMNNVDKSIEYSLRVLPQAKKMNDGYVLGRVLNNLGVSYYKKREYQKALQFQEQSLGVKTKAGDKSGMAFSLNDIGDILLAQDNLNLALDRYNQALEIRYALKDKYAIATTLINLSMVYKKKNDYNKVINYLTEALQSAEEIKSKVLKAIVYKELASNDFAVGRTKEAYQNLLKHSQIQDSLQSNDAIEKTAEIAVVYDLESKQNELKIKSLEVEKEQSKNLLLMVAGLFFASVLFLVLLKYRMVRKQKNSLEETNIERAQKTTELENAIITRDKFFSIISHDLKSPFYGLKGMSEILSESYNELTEDERIDYLKKISKSVRDIYTLIENLLDWSRINAKRIEYKPYNFDIREEIIYCFMLLNPNAEKKKIKLECDIEESLFVYADQQMIHSVVLNFLSNGIKFTNEGGRVRVYSEILKDKIKISIEDNGVGIPADKLKLLFKIDSKYSSRGTGNEKGTGLGLIISQDLVELNGGEIFVSSTLNKGSVFSFTLPIGTEQVI